MTSPRKRLSSQRKEEVCEEAGREPLTYLRNSQRAGIFTWHHRDKTWEHESEDNLMSALLLPEKSRSGAPPMLLPDFTPIRTSLRLCSAKKGKCDTFFALKPKIVFFTHIVSYSCEGTLCQQKSSISAKRFHALSAICTASPLKHTQTREDSNKKEQHQ